MGLDTKFIDIAGLGVGEKSFSKLEKLGLSCSSDLFYYFPRKYEDYSDITRIGDLSKRLSITDYRLSEQSDVFTIKGELIGIANKKTRRRGFTVTEAVVTDDTGSLKVVWFNQPFLVKMLRLGSNVVLHGKVSYDGFAQDYVMESPKRATLEKIVPVYSEISGITSFYISKLFSKVKKDILLVEEWLPLEILTKYDLIGIQEALLNIHEPKNAEMLSRARKRLSFDELFLIALNSAVAKENKQKLKAPVFAVAVDSIKDIISRLPFALTDDQKKAVWQIVKDMEKGVSMQRLLNGDVGSGKTVVAAIASYICALSGYKTLLMVPTEILANQHFETFKQIFDSGLSLNHPQTPPYKGGEIKVGLVTSSNKIDLNSDILIGTQALIQKDFKIDKIGLVIVDEQHRFGVKQREAIKQVKTKNEKRKNKDDFSPHFLSMTATPIPRTLYLALFGDLDLSLIKEKPAMRKEIKTRYVEPFNRDKAYEFIGKQIKSGRQVFVICPLIEEKDELKMLNQAELFEEERKSVKAEYEKLIKIFPEFKLAMLHGKMKSAQKAEIMDDFSKGIINILVSTSVVEVGIDIPNASVVVVEDAEHFGLAQIHQFRGRVGRSEHQSFCFLFSNSINEKSIGRLRLLENINDGFLLAEEDLKLRGPGSLYGIEQSGMVDLKLASLSDQELLKDASESAKEMATKIDQFPKLLEKVNKFSQSNHLE